MSYASKTIATNLALSKLGNDRLQITDFDNEEYRDLLNFIDAKPLENWKEIVKEYTDWLKKSLDNPA